MKCINTDELKKIQLQILSYLDEFCERNNLTYFLIGGSLIGAVRNKGYIPWDDDIDVFLPRIDYERLITIVNEQKNEYTIYTCENNVKYPLPFAKLCNDKTILNEYSDSLPDNLIGINIDLFPIDNINPESLDLKKIKILRMILDFKSIKINESRIFYKNIILMVGKLFCLFLSSNKISCRINRIARKTRGELSGNIVWGYGIKELMPSNIFKKRTRIEFENLKVSVPLNYHDYLRNVYGDYMKVPPKEAQISHHKFDAYWKE